MFPVLVLMPTHWRTLVSLKNKEYAFTLLTALVKRAGGEVRLSESELATVTKKDVVALYWDQKTDEIVLKVNSVLLTPDGGYEN